MTDSYQLDKNRTSERLLCQGDNCRALTPSRKAMGRSKLSNGKKLLPLTDGRSATPCRFKDLVEDIAADLGGKEHLSEG
jgi:hypothetical protein